MVAAVEDIWWQKFKRYANWNLEDGLTIGAVALFANYPEYRELAESISLQAKYSLVWTLHGSPLDTKTDRGITLEDIWFRKFSCRGPKARVVVFTSRSQLRRYVRAQKLARQKHHTFLQRAMWRARARWSLRAKDAARCKRFETYCKGNSHSGGKLYFTTTYLIRRNAEPDANGDGNNLTLDVGAVSASKTGTIFCFQSSFMTSTFTRGRREQIRFFPLTDSCRGVDLVKHYKGFLEDIIKQREERSAWAYTDASRLLTETNFVHRHFNKKKWTQALIRAGKKANWIIDKLHQLYKLLPPSG